MPRQNAWDVSSIETIFFVPISSIIKADFFAAQQFLDYVQSFGFSGEAAQSGAEKSRGGFIGDLKMTSFRFQQSTEGGGSQDRFLRVPALSMIPLPLLQVKEANFDFAVRVVQAERNDRPGPVLLGGREDQEDAIEDCNWKAMLVAERTPISDGEGGSSSSYMNANIKVNMKVHQSDVPAGISRLLAVMNDNTRIVSARLAATPSIVRLKPGDAVDITISSMDFAGEAAKNTPIQIGALPTDQLFLSVDETLWEPGRTLSTGENGELQLNLKRAESDDRQDAGRSSVILVVNGLVEGAKVEAQITVYFEND